MAAKQPKKVTISEPGKAPISFKPGGLHETLGIPLGQKIPEGTMAAARTGHFGPKAQKEALFATNVLAKGRTTAQQNRK